MFCLLFTFSSDAPATPSRPIRILLDSEPLTLNPRISLDVTGQRLGMLLFGALTKLNEDLEPKPDLSENFYAENAGKTWVFKIKQGLKDHSGRLIQPEDMAQCMENYRLGKPRSPKSSAFPYWTETLAAGQEVKLRFSQPDPYLPRNITALRYFRQEGLPPCTEPERGKPVIGSGSYRTPDGILLDLEPKRKIALIPSATDSGLNPIEYVFSADENTRVLALLRGDVDAAWNALSLSKSHWVKTTLENRFTVFERDGVNVSYLAFNMRNQVLAKPDVRRAIALAIDREQIIREKWFGFCSLAGGFLSPLLPEADQAHFPFDPGSSEKLLDHAGYPRGKDGVRLRLRYRTTPSSVGQEMALMFQDMLRRVGVALEIEVVETAVFFSSLKKGKFDLYSSRWIGVADGSILHSALHSTHPMNRIGYTNSEVDAWLMKAMGELDQNKRRELLGKVQLMMAKELPYLPLWFWNNALIASKNVVGADPRKFSLSGALGPLGLLRLDGLE